MFKVLPIDQIYEDDRQLVGDELFKLAVLKRLDFPVAPGVVVLPTEVSGKIMTSPPPEELLKAFHFHQIDAEKLWKGLLKNWLDELTTKSRLSPQPILFTKQISHFGQAYFDPYQETVVVSSAGQPDLPVDYQLALDQWVKKANHTLWLPQVYDWVVELPTQSIWLTKVLPYTDHLEKKVPEYKTDPLARLSKPSAKKSVCKVFVDLSDSLTVNPDADGVYIAADKTSNFDQIAAKLAETAASLSHQPVLFKFAPTRLEQVEAYQFCRQAKALDNLQLIIPAVHSSQQLSELRQLLSSRNVSKTASHHFWLELATPENLLNLKNYLMSGFDGVVLNLNQLMLGIGGSDEFHLPQLLAMFRLLEPALEVVHQQRIPVVFSGSLSTQTEVLEFVVEHGVYGLVTDLGNSYSLSDYLHFLEKRHAHKHVTNSY